MHSLNIVVSQTITIPAKFIRLFTRSKYSHTSICFDDDFNILYSFARKKADNPLIGGFIKEHPTYLSLGKKADVSVAVYKIPITDKVYKKIIDEIERMENDEEYMYNLFSVALYPFHLDFSTYKAYHCTEFAVKLLAKYKIIKLTKKAHRYSPKDVTNVLQKYRYYEGSISELSDYNIKEDPFFEHNSFLYNLKNTSLTIGKLFYRKIWYR